MRGSCILTADQVREAEKLAFSAGESEEEYMKNAGGGIARVVRAYLKSYPLDVQEPTVVTLLVGKGNNG